MNYPQHELDKKELLGFRLLKEDKSKPGRLIEKHIIGSKVGAGKRSLK